MTSDDQRGSGDTPAPSGYQGQGQSPAEQRAYPHFSAPGQAQEQGRRDGTGYPPPTGAAGSPSSASGQHGYPTGGYGTGAYGNGSYAANLNPPQTNGEALTARGARHHARTETNLVQATAAVSTDFVALSKALGGGWESTFPAGPTQLSLRFSLWVGRFCDGSRALESQAGIERCRSAGSFRRALDGAKWCLLVSKTGPSSRSEATERPCTGFFAQIPSSWCRRSRKAIRKAPR